MNEKHIATRVEWHFFVSAATGQGGPSGPLKDLLLGYGFTIVYH